MRNLFYLLAVFISFFLARAVAAVAAADFCCCFCAPPPHPASFFGGKEVSKKRKSPVASGKALGHVFDGVGVVGMGEFAACWERLVNGSCDVG
jgi:hypothetical protein